MHNMPTVVHFYNACMQCRACACYSLRHACVRDVRFSMQLFPLRPLTLHITCSQGRRGPNVKLDEIRIWRWVQVPLVATLTDEPEDYLKAAAAWSIGQARFCNRMLYLCRFLDRKVRECSSQRAKAHCVVGYLSLIPSSLRPGARGALMTLRRWRGTRRSTRAQRWTRARCRRWWRPRRARA